MKHVYVDNTTQRVKFVYNAKVGEETETALNCTLVDSFDDDSVPINIFNHSYIDGEFVITDETKIELTDAMLRAAYDWCNNNTAKLEALCEVWSKADVPGTPSYSEDVAVQDALKLKAVQWRTNAAAYLLYIDTLIRLPDAEKINVTKEQLLTAAPAFTKPSLDSFLSTF